MTARFADMTQAAPLAARNCGHCLAQQSCPISRLRGDQGAELQFQEHSFRVGDVLQSQGSVSTVIRVIKSGTTMLCRESRYGKRQPLGMLGRGTLTGQFGLLGRVNPVTHIGIVEGRYCEISNAALQCSGLLKDPDFMGRMFDVLAHAVENHFDWCLVRNADGVAQQLAGALLHLSGLQSSLRVRLPTQTILAGLLGTTRESITRAFARLEMNGDVSRSGRYYCDLHVDRLVCTVNISPPSQ